MAKGMQGEENSHRHKGNGRRAVHIICIVGLICCLAWLIRYAADLKKGRELAENLRQEYAGQTPAAAPQVTSPPEETPKPTETPEPNLFDGREYPDLEDLEIPQREIDFAGLQEVNPDVYAWLYVPDTNIDYPVLQREGEADYYLTHDMEGNSSTAGCIFTQYYNSRDWTDNHTVIYGHNMRNQSMFATLHNFEDSRFFDEHSYFYIYTPEYTFVYQVFAAYRASNAHLLLGYHMEDHDCFQQYLDDVLAQDGIGVNIDRELAVDADDHIVTLSTCVKGQAQNRYLVQAKLAAVGKTDQLGETEDEGEDAGTAGAGTDR